MVFSVLTRLERSITDITNDVGLNVASVLIPGLFILASTGLTLYFLLKAYEIITGASGQSFGGMLKETLFRVLILSVATTYGFFSDIVFNIPKETIDALSNSFTGSEGVFKNLDRKLVFYSKWWLEAAREAGTFEAFRYIEIVFAYVMIFLGLGAFAVIALITIIVNKVLFTIILGVGPIFIFALAFERTKHFFNSWLSTALTYGGALVIVSIVYLLLDRVLESIIVVDRVGGEETPLGEDFGLKQGVVIILTGLILSVLLFKASDLTGQMFGSGGGISDSVSRVMTNTGVKKGSDAYNQTESKVRQGGVLAARTAKAAYNKYKTRSSVSKE